MGPDSNEPISDSIVDKIRKNNPPPDLTKHFPPTIKERLMNPDSGDRLYRTVSFDRLPKISPVIEKLKEFQGLAGEILSESRDQDQPFGNNTPSTLTYSEWLERDVIPRIAEQLEDEINSTQDRLPGTRAIDRDRLPIHREGPFRRPFLPEQADSDRQKKYEADFMIVQNQFERGILNKDEMKKRLENLFNTHWQGKKVDSNHPAFDQVGMYSNYTIKVPDTSSLAPALEVKEQKAVPVKALVMPGPMSQMTKST